MANYEAFLKVAGLEGESCDHKHPREIELLSFSFGAMGDIEMPGRGALPNPKGMEFLELQVTKYFDRTTPSLLVWNCTNMRLNIVLSVRRVGEEHDFLTVTLSDAVVTCCSVTKTLDGPPTDQVSFRYQKIEIAYVEKGAGRVAGGNLLWGL